MRFERLRADDLLAITAQDSQKLWLGTPGEVTWEQAEVLADNPVAWTAWRPDGSILACFGISELFEGKHGVGWALLSQPIGEHHLALTRRIQAEVCGAGLRRIELLARAKGPARGWLAPVAEVMADPTPECRWAVLLGFTPAHVLRNFGAASESYMLFECLDGGQG